jgi:hypothetical protein
MKYFDLRIRPLLRRRFRLALLPHRYDPELDPDTRDSPWSVLASAPPVALNPGTVKPGDPKDLWLPSPGTQLFMTSRDGTWDGWTRQSFTVSLKAGEAQFVSDDANTPFTGAIHCFGGLSELLGASEPRKTQTARIIFLLRNTKEFLAGLINAFRFPGELIEFARYGETERLVCLSQFVFDLTPPASAPPGFGVDGDWPQAIVVSGQFAQDPVLGLSEISKVDNTNFGPESLRRFVKPREPDMETLLIDSMQDASGIYFRLRAEPKCTAVPGVDRSDFFLLLRRNEGATALGNAPIVARSELDVRQLTFFDPHGSAVQYQYQPRWQVKDSLAPSELAHRQLHYQISLCDSYGDVCGIAKYLTYRLRYDPPPTPEKAEVRLVFAVEAAEPEHLAFTAAFPGLQGQLQGPVTPVTIKELMADAFAPRLYYQPRPLDECGFYGEDDDFGLLEGLREVDDLFDRSAGANSDIMPAEGHPLVANLRGKYDRDGLIAVPIDPARVSWTLEEQKSQIEGPPIATITGAIDVAKLDVSGVGLQFHFALTRIDNLDVRKSANRQPGKAGTDDPSAPEARPTPCTHWIRLKTAPEVVDIQVFQIELFKAPPAEEVARTWRLLKGEHLSVDVIPDRGQPPYRAPLAAVQKRFIPALPAGYFKTASFVVRLQIVYPVPGDLAQTIQTEPAGQPIPAIGGVRILMRDRLTGQHAEPFRVVETIQPLPELVALYRPIQIEAGLAIGPEPEENAGRDFSNSYTPRSTVNPANLWKVLSPGGVVDQARDSLRSIAEAICLDGNFRIRTLDKDPGEKEVAARQPTDVELQARWATWLTLAQKTLRSLEVTTQNEVHWDVIGRLVAVMRKLGLVIDLAARSSISRDVWPAINKALEDKKLPPEAISCKVIAVDTADYRTMATVRLVMMPWAGIGGAGGVFEPPALLNTILPDRAQKEVELLSLYMRAASISPRALRYRDAARAPLNLTLPSTRVLTWHWAGLRDNWHHDCEFAVQVLDRYHRIRERLREERAKAKLSVAGDKTAAQAVALEALGELTKDRIALRDLEVQPPETLVSQLTVRLAAIPRAEPAPAIPGVFPATGRPEHLLSFEILETAESQAAAHNLLARTRSGHLRRHTRLGARFPSAVGYGAGALNNFFSRLIRENPEGRSKLWTGWLEHSTKTLKFPHDLFARRTEDTGLLQWAGEEVAPRAPEPRTGRDLQTWRHAPYYFTYELSAIFTADLMEGPAAVTVATRVPGRLGLAVEPSWSIAGGALTISLVPALLGSHLTAAEFLRATGLSGWSSGPTPLLRRKKDLTETYLDLPHVLLPDLWLEYSFYLDVGHAGQSVLVPFFQWAADRNAGEIIPSGDVQTKPLGFTLTQTLPGLPAGAVVSRWSAAAEMVVEFTLPLSALNPSISTLLTFQRNGQVLLLLRRGPVATDFLPLPSTG